MPYLRKITARPRTLLLGAAGGLLLTLAACTSKSTDPAPPLVLSPIGGKSVVEGELLHFGVSAQGGSGSWPSLSTSPLPSGADFTDNLDGTGTFDWTPASSQVGNYSVVFRAETGGLADSEVVLIQVTDQPPAPPVDTVYLTSDTVSAGDTAVIDLILSNPDSAVAGLNIWLEASAGLRYDTAEALLPRFPVTGMSWSSQRHDSINVMSLLMVDFNLPLDFVSPGSGPLFRLRFSVSPTQPPGTYLVDTTGIVLPRGVDIAYRSGLSVPRVGFVPGQIVVQ
jgi:hypothetical protein